MGNPGGSQLLVIPPHPLPVSCQAGGTFCCRPSPQCRPSLLHPASPPEHPPSWCGPHPIPGAGGRGLTGQTLPPGTAGSGKGWSVRSPGPCLRMLRQPFGFQRGLPAGCEQRRTAAEPGSRCWLGAEPGISSPLLSPSPMQRAEACGRGGRRDGGDGEGGPPLIDAAAAAP